MCCDTTVCGTQNEISRLRFGVPDTARRTINVTTRSGIKSVRRDVEACKTPAHPRQPTQLQVKPVRQCARRERVDLDVAQASPLFSDHAPREVHLWQ